MTQITEDFVSLETAKLLKEKGFDAPVKNYYSLYTEDVKHNLQKKYGAKKNWNSFDLTISRPSQSLVMKWLREVHMIFIRPNINFLYPIRYYCEIFCYGDNLKTQQDVTTERFESPEEACEAAIKYCLENLI